MFLVVGGKKLRDDQSRGTSFVDLFHSLYLKMQTYPDTFGYLRLTFVFLKGFAVLAQTRFVSFP